MVHVEAIPFKNFKDRIKITKELEKVATIEVYKNYLYVNYKN